MRAIGQRAKIKFPVTVTDHIVVPRERHGIELDEFLCLLYPLLNKGFLRGMIRDGMVLLDGGKTLYSKRVRADQVISIDIDENSEDLPKRPVAPVLALDVLYEDEDVMVVDKPAGLPVEPERWAKGNACLSGALLDLALKRSDVEVGHATEIAQGMDFRPRLVHRIDKDTTGAVLVAKNIETERRLREAFAEGTVHKSYLALVEGEYPLEDGEDVVIDLPIGADNRKSGRMRVDENGGKSSQTKVQVEQRFTGYTLMRCAPLTGRTHQIRVHLSATGFPLVVDPSYGRRSELALSEFKRNYRPKRGGAETPLINRLTLHAERIAFPDRAGQLQHVEAPLPKDFQRILKQLSKVRPPRRSGGSRNSY
jgi:23S rRNA pseudouridine1911/1915/1917 synthase